MHYHVIPSTGIQVSTLAFGAGPVPALMTGEDRAAQRDAVRQALELGINWFDTAATYGDGESELHLGTTLRELGALPHVHLATKVRLDAEQLQDPTPAVRESLLGSLRRLGTDHVTLLQLHNAITRHRNEIPTSLTVDDVLRPRGVLEALLALREAGLVRAIGFTGIGDAASLRSTVAAGGFQTVQVPFHLANPSAGFPAPPGFCEADFGDVISLAAARGLAVFAIRVFAGGALALQPPSDYTYRTRFFPLELYRRDEQAAARLQARLPAGMTLREAALRFAISHAGVTSAIVGFRSSQQVSEAARDLEAGSLAPDLIQRLVPCAWQPVDNSPSRGPD